MKYVNKWVLRCVLFVCMSVYFSSRVGAQNDYHSGIKKGDVLPDLPFRLHLGDSVFSGSLSQFKGQLVIFDFWHTSCSSCLESMPEMLILQRQFAGKVKIILVTPNNDQELNVFWKKFRSSRRDEIFEANQNLTSITSDSTLSGLFNEHTFPTHVWVDSEGRYLYMSDIGTTTPENIRRVLSGERVDLLLRSSRVLDYNHPFSWLSESTNDANEPLVYSFISPRIEHEWPLHGIGFIKDSTLGTVVGFQAVNVGVLSLIRFALDAPNELMHKGRIRITGKDSAVLFMPSDPYLATEWVRQHTYCYGMKMCGMGEGAIRQRILADLRFSFGYQCSIERCAVHCLILKKGANFLEAQVQSARRIMDSTYLEGYDVSMPMSSTYLADRIEIYLEGIEINVPVVDESGCDNVVTAVLPNSHFPGGLTLGIMKSFLGRYGFKLEEGIRNLNVLVISQE